jgi:hypothetical protein
MESVFYLDRSSALSSFQWEDIRLHFSRLVSAHSFHILIYFSVIAGIYLVFYPCIVGALHSYNRQKEAVEAKRNKDKPPSDTDKDKEQVKVSALIKHPRFLFGLFSQMLLLMSI